MAAQKASFRDANGAGDRQHARPRRIHPATDAGAGDGVWASSTYHGGTSNHSTSEVTIGQVNVDTKATDAKGIADAIAPQLRHAALVAQMQSGQS